MSHPVILGIDTSGHHCAVGLLRGDGAIATRFEEMKKGQAERLIPLAQDLLDQEGFDWSDLTAIGVGIGPGNFTGIRIAVSAARGVGLGLNIPVVGASMFDTTQLLSNYAQTVVPAPREQAYVMDFDKMTTPIHCPNMDGLGAFAISTDHTVTDHVIAITKIASQRASADTPAPAPLYVKPADAAPPRDAAPVILS